MRLFLITFTTLYMVSLAHTAENYKEVWQVSTPDVYPPYLIDCTNCNDEEVGAVFSCDAKNKLIKLEFNASASEAGENGQRLPAIISLDGKKFNRNIHLLLYWISGYTPILTLNFDDKILETFKSTKIIKLHVNGRVDEYNSQGFAPAFSQFLKRCLKK